MDNAALHFYTNCKHLVSLGGSLKIGLH